MTPAARVRLVLAGAAAVAGTTITTASPDGDAVTTHCRVDGHVAVPGNTVSFRLALPAAWNGKFYFQGVGGRGGSLPSLRDGLVRGYASATTDTGHVASDPRWGQNRAKEIDYGHRGTTLAALLMLCLAGQAAAQTRAPFTIAGQAVPAGTRADLDIPVRAGADPATVVPVTVFHGAADGPVLALTAGVHGFEFVPILAGQRLLTRIDPARLRGTVVLVRIAHLEAFLQRVPYVNPFDRKNLNRMFPGKADGTQAERIAWALTTEVIRRCDVHVELHGGDGAEWMEPFAGPYGGPLAEAQYAQSRAMALAFNFRNVIKYEMKTQAQVDSGRSLNRQAVADGKPTVLVEIGQNGERDDASISALTRGLENLLATLKMTAGTPVSPRADTRWFADSAEASATKSGIFTPVATTGRAVKKGDLIGTVTDTAGREIERIVSPVDGYVMYGLAGPPVRAGEAVVTIGIPAAGPL